MLPSFQRHAYAVGGVGAGALGHKPEHVHHVPLGHHRTLGVALGVKDLGTTHPVLGVLHIIPLFAQLNILTLQFRQGGQVRPVGFDELNVGLALVHLGGDVLTGEVPMFGQYLALKSIEGVFDRLTTTIVRSGGPMPQCQLREKGLRGEFLMSALVVVHDLHRFHTGTFYGHTIGEILSLIVFALADMVTNQALARRIHHLVHHNRAHLAIFVSVVQVQLRTVAVPYCIGQHRQLGRVLPVELLVSLLLAIHSVPPLHLDLRLVEPLHQRTHTLQRFPSFAHRAIVVARQDLIYRQQWHLAPSQCYQVVSTLCRDLARVLVRQLATDHTRQPLILVLQYLLAERLHTLGQRMRVVLTQGLAALGQYLPQVAAAIVRRFRQHHPSIVLGQQQLQRRRVHHIRLTHLGAQRLLLTIYHIRELRQPFHRFRIVALLTQALTILLFQ